MKIKDNRNRTPFQLKIKDNRNRTPFQFKLACWWRNILLSFILLFWYKQNLCLLFTFSRKLASEGRKSKDVARKNSECSNSSKRISLLQIEMGAKRIENFVLCSSKCLHIYIHITSIPGHDWYFRLNKVLTFYSYIGVEDL